MVPNTLKHIVSMCLMPFHLLCSSHYYEPSSPQQSSVVPRICSFQQRLSYTTLSDLALRLIDGTVYDIVFHHYNVSLLSSSCPVLKQDLIHKHKEALQVCKSHNLVVMKTNRQGETEALEIEVREEQMMDDKILVEMDQKVINQQNTLEIARVPGFYITTNPQLNQHFVLLYIFRTTFL
uniref:DiGeorge syndrome critical region gene 6 n=1 Tax=Salmo trutta TaxID=8032 RepID=A0A674CU16_SALTR